MTRTLIFVAGACVLVLVIVLIKSLGRGGPQEIVSVTYADFEWRGAVHPEETLADQAAVLKPPSWLDVILSSSIPKGRATPFQLAYTTGGAVLLAHRDSGGGLSEVERHNAGAVEIEKAEPERAGSPYVSVDLRLHGKRRSFVHVPAAFFSDFRRALGR